MELNTNEIQAGTVKKPQSRWKSKVLWAAVAAQAIALLQMLGVFDKLGFDAGAAGDFVAAVLQALAIVGVVNDPTNGEGW